MKLSTGRTTHRTRTVPAVKGHHCYLPQSLIKMMRDDAVKFNKSIDDITALIYRGHFAFKTEVRAALYKSLPSKRMGRKVAS